jgi:hypothetical protein
MNRFAQIFFIAFAANLASFGLGFLEPGFFVLLLVMIPGELIVGFVLMFYEQHRQTGAGLLVAAGVSLLVAGFICSSLAFGFR